MLDCWRLFLCAVSPLTFVESIIIHVSIHIQIFSSHQGELCFGILIWSIVGIITADRQTLSAVCPSVMAADMTSLTCIGQCKGGPGLCSDVWTGRVDWSHPPSIQYSHLHQLVSTFNLSRLVPKMWWTHTSEGLSCRGQLGQSVVTVIDWSGSGVVPVSRVQEKISAINNGEMSTLSSPGTH